VLARVAVAARRAGRSFIFMYVYMVVCFGVGFLRRRKRQKILGLDNK
jgi:hypothetical protein